MAELTPIPAAQRPAEPGYQPLSGYAVAAAIVAGVFALALVVLVGIGLWSRRTPLSYELLLVPVSGVILSIIARSHVRNAEGTRTGMRLANGSWWVCMLGGAGFAAFLAANDVALRRESQRQADGFLEALRSGREQEAFDRFVLPPEMRGRADVGTPEYEQVYGAFGYPAFVNHPVVYGIRTSGSATKIEHLGARDVGQEGDGFKATHKYRITIPEGVFVTQLKLVASEPRGGGKPQWHIDYGRSIGVTVPEWESMSRYGKLEMQAQEEAEKFARDWMGHLTSGRLGLANLYTRPQAERERGTAELTAAAALAGAGLFAQPVGPSGQPRPAVDELLKSGLFRKDASGTPIPDAKLDELRSSWANVSISPVTAGRRQAMGLPEAFDRTTFTLSPTELLVTVPADLIFGAGGRKAALATVGVVCTDPEFVNHLAAAKAEGAAARDDGTTNLRTLPPRDWRIAWVRTTLEPAPGPTGQPGGPGGPGGPDVPAVIPRGPR